MTFVRACRCSQTSDEAPDVSEESVDSPAECSQPLAKRVHLDQPESRLDIVSYIAMSQAEREN